MKKRLLAVVMALAMVLAYMPAMVFAADGSKPEPTGLEYKGAEFKYVEGNDYADGFYVEGNIITVSFSDGTTKDFIYKIYKKEQNGDAIDEYGDYFLNGDINTSSADIREDFKNGKVTISYRETYWSDELGKDVELKVEKEYEASKYAKPVKVEYKGDKLRYEPDDDHIENLFNEGNKLIVTYDDGSTRTYICKKYKNNNESYSEYFLDGKLTKDSNGEYQHVFVLQEWVKRPLGTTSTVLTFEEYVGGGDSFNLKFKVPLKYIIYNDTVLRTAGAKKALTAKWNKAYGKVDGYEVQYSTSKAFKGAKKKTVKGKTKTSVKISNLKAKKKYYVRIRTYRTYKGKKYYSEWSKTKAVKTK